MSAKKYERGQLFQNILPVNRPVVGGHLILLKPPEVDSILLADQRLVSRQEKFGQVVLRGRRIRDKDEEVNSKPITTLELDPHSPRPTADSVIAREIIMDKQLEVFFIVGPQGSGKSTLAEVVRQKINTSKITDPNGQAVFARSFSYDDYREKRLEVHPNRNEWTEEDSDIVETGFLDDVLHFLEPSPSHPDTPRAMRRKVILDATAFDDGISSRGLDTLVKLIEQRGAHAVRVLALVPNPKILEETIRSRVAAVNAQEFRLLLKEGGVVVERPITRRRGGFHDEEILRRQMLRSGFADTTLSRLSDWFGLIQKEFERRVISMDQINQLFQLPEFLHSITESDIIKFIKQLGGSLENVINSFIYFFKKIFSGNVMLPEGRMTVAMMQKSETLTRIPGLV